MEAGGDGVPGGMKGAIGADSIDVMRGKGWCRGALELHGNAVCKGLEGCFGSRWGVGDSGERDAFGDSKAGFSCPLCETASEKWFVGLRSGEVENGVLWSFNSGALETM